MKEKSLILVRISKLLHWAGEKILMTVFFSTCCEVLATSCFLYAIYALIARELAPKMEPDLFLYFSYA